MPCSLPDLTSLCSQGLFLEDFTANSHQARSDLPLQTTLWAVSRSPAVGFEAEKGSLSVPAPAGIRNCNTSSERGQQEQGTILNCSSCLQNERVPVA